MSNIDIGFYISILVRRLPYVVAITLVALLAAATATRYMPPSYTASARMLAEAPQIPTELASSTVQVGATAQLLIIQQQITTRDALLALARKLDIYAGSKVKPSDEDITRDLRSRIRFEQEKLDGEVGGVSVFTVSFSANKPVLAATVANGLVSMILDRNQSERTGLASSTLQFFNQKVDGLDADLKHLEADLLKFKNQNKDTLPESLDFHRSQQVTLQDRLASLEREEADLRTRRNTTIVSYTTSGQTPGNVALSPEQQMLADLNRALADQLTIFTEDSPNIRAIRARIAQLQKNMVATRPDTTTNEEGSLPKAPFGLELQLSDIDGRLQTLANEKLTISQRIADLTKWIAATPATETVLDSMMRNRTNIQTQYNAAIARRAEALTGEQIEKRADGERFSLLEPATPPARARGPVRKLIVAGGGAVGLGIGVALIVLLELLNKTVRRPKDLERLLQSIPLATIPVVRTSHEIRAARIKLGTAAFLSAGVMPASLLALHYYYMPLDLVFQKLVSSFGWIGTT